MSSATEDTLPSSEPRTVASTRSPAQISRFEIQSKLGEGGNGVVWLAHDPLLDRKVAIKVLHRNDSADAAQRLLREAQSAAKLVHENIIIVHDVGMAEGRAYVAMEYVAGMPLGRWQTGRSWRDVVNHYLRAGRGLAAAHAAGFVHRDFKPDNVLVGDDGRVRVTDFGLVSVDGVEMSSPDALLDRSLTDTGAILGTPRYMAPEQHQSADVDARADQFAFCAALYGALYGQAPFAGETYSELSKNVCDGALRPPPADANVPAAIRDAITRGLSRQRDDRFASMNELVEVLAGSLPVRAPHHRRWVLLAGTALCLVGVLVWWFFVRAKPQDPGREAFNRGEAAYHRGDYATAAAEFRRALALDPDMQHVGEEYVYNIAAALEESGDCAGARNMYGRYLAISTKADAKERARIEKHIGELAACATK
jgi:predicted Ser/Thr protein kinase